VSNFIRNVDFTVATLSFFNTKGQTAMAMSERVRPQASRSLANLTIAVACLSLLLGSEPGWAGGPPNPTPSDSLENTAGGYNALYSNTAGNDNTAFGDDALALSFTGSGNTAIGAEALDQNYNGGGNTASGVQALEQNFAGNANTAIGIQALVSNIQGSYNTAIGAYALFGAPPNATEFSDCTFLLGCYNTASGAYALFGNTTGYLNTASGYFALYDNTTGSDNTASGDRALYANETGSNNTAFGNGALTNNNGGLGGGDDNTAVGRWALLSNTSGSNNTAIGAQADVSAGNYSNGTALGYQAQLTASNSIVLGNNSITKIYAQVTTISGISDRRHKKDIRALDADLGLDFIEKLKPVSYRFNNGDETQRYGFVAQDLEQALPVSLHDTIERSKPEPGLALIERENDKDRTYRVSYGELTAPIVKAIQQQQQEIEVMRHALATVERQLSALKAQNAALRHSITGQRAQITAAR
jgi:trimeric autotransporter adhesin